MNRKISRYPLVALHLFLFATAASGQALEETLEGARTVLNEIAEDFRVPGLSAVVHRDGELLLEHSIGFADLEHRAPASASSVYRLGAATMPFTAVAVLQQIEAERYKLDTPIGELLPALPAAWTAVTVEDLLRHRSGLPDYTLTDAWKERRREDMGFEQLIGFVREQELEFQPRTHWAISTTNYLVLGRLLEEQAKKPLAKVLNDNVLRVHGLSGVFMDDSERIVRNRVRGYEVSAKGRRNADWISMSSTGAAAGLAGSAAACADWLDALQSGKLLNETSMALLTGPHELDNGQPVEYGMGFAVGSVRGRRVWAAQGFLPGFTAHLAIWPDEGLSIAVLCNTTSRAAALGASQLSHRLHGLAGPEASHAALVGTYQTAEGDLEVSELASALRIKLPILGQVPLVSLGGRQFKAGEDGPALELRFLPVEGPVERLEVLLEGTRITGQPKR